MTDDVVFLEWTFSPPDYFEEAFVIKRDSYTMTIGEGTAKAHADPAAYNDSRELRNALHNELNDYFLGVKLLTHEPYKLSNASMFRRSSDGREIETVFPNDLDISISMTPLALDTLVRDEDGRILEDSRQDRIEHKRRLAALVAKHRSRDQVVAALVESYGRAVNDPDNELVHLYEVKDALAKVFGGEHNAGESLDISKSEWERLRRLANDFPLKQGRHRGKKLGELRDATGEELKEARKISRKMIEAYLDYLETHSEKQIHNS